MKLKRYYERKFGKQIYWVSDFRDAWTDYLTTPKRWFIPSAVDKQYEKNAVKNSDAVTIVANGIKDDFDRKYPEISAKTKYVLIRNGYDSVDYKTAPLPKDRESQSGKFTMVYTGSMYGKRNPYYLLDNVLSLVKEGKIDINKIRFLFVGRMGGDVSDYLRNSPLVQCIKCIPYVMHSESIGYLMESDAMLLIIDEDKYSKMILSGKVFEYLGAARLTGKPVFAIAGNGEAKDLIEETKSGFVSPHNNPELLKENFLKLYNGFFENKQSFSPDSEAIIKYERRLLTEKLAMLFNELEKSQDKA
jgi:glycosyltransferase involved in cell wall biosynthesis